MENSKFEPDTRTDERTHIVTPWAPVGAKNNTLVAFPIQIYWGDIFGCDISLFLHEQYKMPNSGYLLDSWEHSSARWQNHFSHQCNHGNNIAFIVSNSNFNYQLQIPASKSSLS